jgi:transcriptional regulator with XRE-family HTH domain
MIENMCNLKQLLKEQGITQAHLARSMGLSTSNINRWFTNSSVIPLERALQMAKILGVDVMQIRPDVKLSAGINEDLLLLLLTQVPIYLVEIKGVYLENALVAKLISVMYKSIIAGDIKPDNESIKAYIQLYSDYEHY